MVSFAKTKWAKLYFKALSFFPIKTLDCTCITNFEEKNNFVKTIYYAISTTSKYPPTMSLATDLFWFLNHLCNISFHLTPLGPSETLWFLSLFKKTEKTKFPL